MPVYRHLLCLACLGCFLSACTDQTEAAGKQAPATATVATTTANWTLGKLHCDGCANRIEFEMGKLPGVTACTVTFDKATSKAAAEISYDAAQVKVDTLAAKIQAMEYTIEERHADSP